MANYELDVPFSTELRKLDPKEPNHADTAFNPHFKQLVNNDRYLNEQLLDAQTKVTSHKHNASDINAGTMSVGRGGTGVTTITGLVKGNGANAFSAAVAGTDYVAPNGNITGNAATATKLQTTRTIAVSGGATGTTTSFDGSANITIPITALDVSKANAGTLPVGRGGTGVTTITGLVKGNGTNAVSVAVAGTDYVAPGGNITGSSGSCTGNATTATTLATGRTIQTNLASTSAVSFNGSANITPGVTGILPVANGGTGNATGNAATLGGKTVDQIIAAASSGFVVDSWIAADGTSWYRKYVGGWVEQGISVPSWLHAEITINLLVPMANTNYMALVSHNGISDAFGGSGVKTTTTFHFYGLRGNGYVVDRTDIVIIGKGA